MPATSLLQKNAHAAFVISLAFEGAFSLAEIAAGMFAYFVTQRFLLDLVQVITQTELTEDPRDFVAHYLLQAAQGLSVSGQGVVQSFVTLWGTKKVH